MYLGSICLMTLLLIQYVSSTPPIITLDTVPPAFNIAGGKLNVTGTVTVDQQTVDQNTYDDLLRLNKNDIQFCRFDYTDCSTSGNSDCKCTEKVSDTEYKFRFLHEVEINDFGSSITGVIELNARGPPAQSEPLAIPLIYKATIQVNSETRDLKSGTNEEVNTGKAIKFCLVGVTNYNLTVQIGNQNPKKNQNGCIDDITIESNQEAKFSFITAGGISEEFNFNLTASSDSDGLSGGIIALIVILVLAVGGGLVGVLYRRNLLPVKSSSSQSNGKAEAGKASDEKMEASMADTPMLKKNEPI